MRTVLVVPRGRRALASLEHVLAALRPERVSRIEIDDSRLSRLDREGARLERDSVHTPEPLLASWRFARNLERATRPGDIVVISDQDGLGGVFALDQRSRPDRERRQVWTVAADSQFLDLQVVAGTHDGVPMPLASSIDWEIVQYRFSDRVLATSQLAALLLDRIGVQAEIVGKIDPETPEKPRPADRVAVWVPGPVGRRNQTGEILRAVTSVPDARVWVSAEDDDDRIWTGTTWEALRHSRAVLGARVERVESPEEPPSHVVLGDPLAVPGEDVRRWRTRGIPVLVPTGSVAAQMWPQSPTWKDSDDLSLLLSGKASSTKNPSVEFTVSSAVRADRSRATSVSVGVPVFRDVAHLDECVESILHQHQPAHEIVLIDDGSNSPKVDAALEAWARRHERIRILRVPHRGVCVARNTALDHMTGDSFLFVDADDILEPEFISRTAEMLRTDSRLWAVGTWTRFFGTYEGVEAKPPFDRRVGLRENPIISTSALVDMKVRDLGIRFAPDLAFLFCEDWHVWSQIVAAGGHIGLVPAPLARHRVHGDSGGHMRTDLAYALGRARATEPLLQGELRASQRR